MLKLKVNSQPYVGQVVAFMDDDGEEVRATIHSLDRDGNAQLEVLEADLDEDELDDDGYVAASILDGDDDDDVEEADLDDEDYDDVEEADLDEDDDDVIEAAVIGEDGEEIAYTPRRRVRSKKRLTPAEKRKRDIRNRKNRVKNRVRSRQYRKVKKTQLERNAKKRLSLNIKLKPRVDGFKYSYK